MEEDPECSRAAVVLYGDRIWKTCSWSPWCRGAELPGVPHSPDTEEGASLELMDQQFCSSTSQTLLPSFPSPRRAALSSRVVLLQ